MKNTTIAKMSQDGTRTPHVIEGKYCHFVPGKFAPNQTGPQSLVAQVRSPNIRSPPSPTGKAQEQAEK